MMKSVSPQTKNQGARNNVSSFLGSVWIIATIGFAFCAIVWAIFFGFGFLDVRSIKICLTLATVHLVFIGVVSLRAGRFVGASGLGFTAFSFLMLCFQLGAAQEIAGLDLQRSADAGQQVAVTIHKMLTEGMPVVLPAVGILFSIMHTTIFYSLERADTKVQAETPSF